MHVYVFQAGATASQQVAEILHASFQLLHPFITKDHVLGLSANLLLRAVRSSTYCIDACDSSGAYVVPGQDGAAKQLQLELKFLLNYHGLSSTDFEAVSAAAVDACGAILSCDSIMKWLSSMDLC